MVHFDREKLLTMQLRVLDYRRDRIAAWLIIAHILCVIIAVALAYFVSVSMSILVVAFMLFADAMIYLGCSNFALKVKSGKKLEQDIISIEMIDGALVVYSTVFAEDTVTKKLTLRLEYIKSVYQLSDVVFFNLKNKGKMRLPYNSEAVAVYDELSRQLGKKYKRYR